MLTPTDIVRFYEAGDLDPALIPVAGATWVDPLEFDRLRRSIEESGGRGDASLLEFSETEVAKALGAVEGNGETVAVRLLGLLLFGREAALRRLVTTHEVAFQELNGAEVGINDFFRWPLFRVFDEVTARFRHRLHATEVITSHGVLGRLRERGLIAVVDDAVEWSMG